MPDDKPDPAREIRNDLAKEIREKRRKLRVLMQSDARRTDLDVEDLVRYYKQLLSDRPIVILAEDIQQLAYVYSNMLQEVKRIPLQVLNDSARAGDITPTVIRKRYEKLGLVEADTLPNPAGDELARELLDGVSWCSRALLQVISNHGEELARGLGIQSGATLTMQVEVGIPAKLSIGLDRSAGPR